MNPPETRWWKSLASAPPLALAALLATTLACGQRNAEPPPPAPSDPVRGGTAVVAVAADIATVNPLLNTGDAFNESILDAMFLRLFEEQPDFATGPPTFAPQLAESWRWSDDGTTLEIDLRRDVTWDDGAPLTADDVVWTWRLQTDQRLAWSYAGMKSSILDVQAIDAGRLRVSFTGPSPSRLAELNQGHVVPRHRWRELPIERWRGSGGWFVDNLAVSGPFRLGAWRRGEQIELVRNPAFHRAGLPRLDRVVFRIVPVPSNRLAQLLSGDVDFVAALTPDAIDRVTGNPGTRLEVLWHPRYGYLNWNLARPALAEAAARQALVMAIDRWELVDTLWSGHARVAHSPIVSTVWAHRADPGPWPHDPDRARRLLASLGWRDEDGDGVLDRDGERFSIEIMTNVDNRVRTDAAVLIQEDLRRIGVEVRVRQMEWNAMVVRLKAGDFDAVINSITIDTTLDLGYGFHSDPAVGTLNFGGYANPQVDRLIEAFRRSQDRDERARLLWQLQGILHKEQPFAFLWEPQRLHGVAERLRGLEPHPLDSYSHLEEWWLAPARR